MTRCISTYLLETALCIEPSSGKSLRHTFLLEKDIQTVAVLGILFDVPFAGDLIFKDGTSLSKAWCAMPPHLQLAESGRC